MFSKIILYQLCKWLVTNVKLSNLYPLQRLGLFY